MVVPIVVDKVFPPPRACLYQLESLGWLSLSQEQWSVCKAVIQSAEADVCNV